MNPFIYLMLVAFAVASAYGEPQNKKKKESGLDKILRSMFPSHAEKKEVKTVAKPRKKRSEIKGATQSKSTLRVVDSEWIANYLEQEKAWKYPIPDDDEIEFKDGKYHVPPVVFKHYEDMLNTARRPTPTPTPNLRTGAAEL